MRFMIIVKATKSSEAGALPSEEQRSRFGRCSSLGTSPALETANQEKI
jgi:hypothetical protein